MNYLAHLYLSAEDPEEQLGSLVADFTRGRLETLARVYPPGVMRGIILHRQIDRFTDDNRWVAQGKARFSPRHRRYAGIILDILYDHFLSQYWSDYSNLDRLGFIQGIYRLLAAHRQRLPAGLRQLSPRMQREDWLGSYHDLEMIGRVYERMAGRLRRPNPLADALDEVRLHYPQLAREFNLFFPELIGFVQQQQERLDNPSTPSR